MENEPDEAIDNPYDSPREPVERHPKRVVGKLLDFVAIVVVCVMVTALLVGMLGLIIAMSWFVWTPD